MGWTGDVTTETLMEEAGEYCGDISGVALDLKRVSVFIMEHFCYL